jgi:hypothetical protein
MGGKTPPSVVWRTVAMLFTASLLRNYRIAANLPRLCHDSATTLPPVRKVAAKLLRSCRELCREFATLLAAQFTMKLGYKFVERQAQRRQDRLDKPWSGSM